MEVLYQSVLLSQWCSFTLRILGPSNGGVGTCIAGVWVLKIGTFEGSGYLGYINLFGVLKKNHPLDMNILEPEPSIRISWNAEVASEHRVGGQDLQVFVAPRWLCGKSLEGAVSPTLGSQLMANWWSCDPKGTWRIIPGLGYVVNNHG